MPADMVRHDTRDGGLIHHSVDYYLLCRLANLNEKVRVVGHDLGGRSILDGEQVTRYVVENPQGERFVVEPWHLSRLPPDVLYRQLRAQRSSLRVPVSDIQLVA